MLLQGPWLKWERSSRWKFLCPLRSNPPRITACSCVVLGNCDLADKMGVAYLRQLSPFTVLSALLASALSLFRSHADLQLVFGGLRPGEIFALQRKHVQPNAVKIEQCVYSGKLDSPQSRASSRTVAIPASLSSELHTRLSILPPAPDAWIFPSETGLTPARPENVWRRWIGPRLERIGLGGVNFQVLRRTHASLGHAAGIDPKVRADQMGNGIGVNLVSSVIHRPRSSFGFAR
jgi:integrase